MATLTPHQRLASRALGLLLDEATQSRLKLHGFHGAGFGCVARGMEPPRSISSALSVCIEEAAEPVDGSGAEGGPEGFRQFTVDGDPAIACGDVEALGARFAIPYYQRRIARLQAMLPATQRDLRDLAEMATERCAALIKGVREARKDLHIDAAEYDELDAQAMAAEADLAAVRAEIARGRAALRTAEEGR